MNDTERHLRHVSRQLMALTAERDGLVVQRRAEGAALRNVANEIGLSPEAVKRILSRLGAR
jgi:DNA-directed RNA polymerase specialized sigma24 family protein